MFVPHSFKTQPHFHVTQQAYPDVVVSQHSDVQDRVKTTFSSFHNLLCVPSYYWGQTNMKGVLLEQDTGRWSSSMHQHRRESSSHYVIVPEHLHFIFRCVSLRLWSFLSFCVAKMETGSLDVRQRNRDQERNKTKNIHCKHKLVLSCCRPGKCLARYDGFVARTRPRELKQLIDHMSHYLHARA